MNRHLGIKLGAIALLIVLLLIPLLMIDGLVDERQSYRDEVLQDIARSASYSQQLTGPLVVVPYTRTIRGWRLDKASQQRVLQEREVRGRLYFLPEVFSLDGQMRTELRHRGIYEARLFHADSQVSGSFVLPANYGISGDLASYRFDDPVLAVGISDVRGIENAPKLKVGDELRDFQPGTQSQFLGNGVHAVLPIKTSDREQRFDYSFELALLGSSRLDITPVGRDSQVNLVSDWPHPSFGGEFLPTERSISEKGFSARWRTSFFATNLEDQLRACTAPAQADVARAVGADDPDTSRASSAECSEFGQHRFGVALVDPVDQYLKTDRAVKYALLFIVLTFAGFFLFEVLKRLSVHPIQYALVGMALALFYLLLLSLSEHVGFELAYLLSAGACVGLIGFYLCHVLHSLWRGAGFSLGLAGLYGMLYALLSAEDYALLMGSLLLFGVLGGVMVLTRHLDWYGIGKPRGDDLDFSLEDVRVQR
ncbi:cell envelope integrity protein CreD [Pseudomonas sp. YH-1]|uniref:cell envelope integrity protein CreD n=1 Tax=Pseudomonas sp. YH-1 TaxID=3384787 RepID=UPI003F80367E